MLNTLSPVLWLRYFSMIWRGISSSTDRGKRIGLLAVDMNPPSAVVCLRKYHLLTTSSIRICQSGKSRKDEHIPHEL